MDGGFTNMASVHSSETFLKTSNRLPRHPIVLVWFLRTLENPHCNSILKLFDSLRVIIIFTLPHELPWRAALIERRFSWHLFSRFDVLMLSSQLQKALNTISLR
jgi:hypothetical protein